MIDVIDVHDKFHDEHIAFSKAGIYLYSAYFTAVKGLQPIAQEHDEFADAIAPQYKKPRDYFMARLFIGHISAFELFLQELVAVVVRRHPFKVGRVQFKLAEILQAEDPDILIQRATEEVLNKIMYKKPMEYLGEICKLLSVKPSLVSKHWPTFIEAKARRDLGVHNGWICNAVYLRKISEAKLQNNSAIGQSLLPTDHGYIEIVTDSLYEIAKLLYNEVR